MIKRIIIFFLWCFTFFAISCNSYEKLLKSDNLELKYDKAIEYYQKEDYYHAQPLFEELISVYKGSKNIEKIYYYYAYCDYGLGNYLLASYHFKNFYQTYPKSEYAEDAQFRQAYCYYLLSPVFSLDQESTYKAIDAFQLFINMRPESEKVSEANDLIDDLREKLEKKAYMNAVLYYNVKNYKAATITFKNLLLDFPDTDDAEKAHFLIFKSYKLFAAKSIDSKKLERYELASNAYHDFINRYPDSEYKQEATKTASGELISPYIETRNLKEISDKTMNIYEALSIISKRSNQLNVQLKEELHTKLAEFASTSDNLEEIFENREQIEISRYYEKLPSPVIRALHEFMEDKIYYRRPSEEDNA